MEWLASVISAISYVGLHLPEILAALNALVAGLIGFFMIIPGEQPEKFLHQCADFLAQFSRKKDDK